MNEFFEICYNRPGSYKTGEKIMPLHAMEHILIFVKDINATKNFYENILGLTAGYRPPFPFPGYWFYLGNTPVIHVAPAGNDEERKRYLSFSAQTDKQTSGSGVIDHVAFKASDKEHFINKLNAAKIQFIDRVVPEEGNLQQIFLKDPNDITIELNFRE